LFFPSVGLIGIIKQNEKNRQIVTEMPTFTFQIDENESAYFQRVSTVKLNT
jgi:hypothetical protein